MVSGAKQGSKWWRIILVILLLALPFVVMRIPWVRRVLVELVEYMRKVPVGGIAVFLAAETMALMMTTPIWLMSGLAGYAYGFGWGMALAWPGVTLCASVVFMFGRTFMRKLISSRSAQSHYWRAVDHAVRANGFKVAFLMRVAVAIPQNLATYMLAATPLRLRDFALGSLCGLFPVTLLHVYIGSKVESAAALISGENSAGGPLAWVSLGVGLAMTLGAVIVASQYARKALDQALAEAARGQALP